LVPFATLPPFGLLFGAPLPAVLAGAAAVSLPIIIHLLNRRRYRIVTWAAMRFLLAAQKQNTRRMRLEQLILLILRTAIVLLLVLAMASVMPWCVRLLNRLFPGSAVHAATASQRTHKVLVLDGSLSMALRAGDTTCFDRARRRAAEILDGSPRGDGFSVVVMAGPPQRLVPGPSDDAQKVRQAIDELRLPHGNANVVDSLQEVERILSESPADKFAVREVYFLTDLQRSTWVGAQPVKAELLKRIQDRARLIFLDVGQDAVPNLAVTDVRLGAPLALTGVETPVLAMLHNYGGQEPRQVRVELLVGKARATLNDAPLELRVAQQEVVTVPPGRRGEPVRFRHRFSTPGEYVLQVRVEHDALEPDDVRSAVVSVKDSLPVLLVNGSTEGESATELLQTALNPFPPGLAPRTVAARPKTISVRDFNYASAADLAAYECVFLCDVERLTVTEVTKLETYLRGGGGLVVCLGPRVNFDEYNRVLYRGGRGILPARLMGKREAARDRYYALLADEEAYRHPPLEAFAADSDRLSLRSARFRQHVATEPAPRGQPRTLLTFLPDLAPSERAADERPGAALIEWQPPLPEKGRGEGDRADADPPTLARPPASGPLARYRGRVVLLTTTVNREWADWPVSPSFLPFMQELVHHAASGRLRAQGVEVGQPLEEFLPFGQAGQDLTVRTPDGREERTASAGSDEGALLRWAETDQSGVYRVTVGRHPQEHLFAVNVPFAADVQEGVESDLARTNRDELQATYRDWQFQLVSDPHDVVHTGGPAPVAPLPSSEDLAAQGAAIGAAVARVLLWTLIALLLVEVVLAWRFGHFSAVGGVETPPSRGRLLPGFVGIVAGLVFLTATFVLIQTAWSGDFLSFLGEGTRRAIEDRFGVPRPVAGEGSRWHLEFTPYFAASHATNLWVAGTFAVAALALVVGIYLVEGHTAGTAYRMLLAGLRGFTVLLALVVLLPQLRLLFERQGWPDIALVIDDSRSMSVSDPHRDPRIVEAIEKLATGNPKRLELAQALLTRNDPDWLTTLLTERKFKVHVYRVSGGNPEAEEPATGESVPRAWPLHLTAAGQRDAAVQAIQQVQARAETSPLGATVRRVINDFRGASLAAVVLLSDGVTTEGEDLLQVAPYAERMGVPLFYVGIGASHELRDVQLHDLQVEDAVYVNDRVVFEGRLTGQGYTDLVVPVRLKEKDKDGRERMLKTVPVRVDPAGKPVKFRIVHQPTEPGEKVFVVEAQEQPDEVKPATNNRLERLVHVRDAKLIKVLYVEGYARYEYRFIKHLLERESAKDKRNKSIDLRVLLLEAEDEYASEDRSALADFPNREELNGYDVVLLGDVDPRSPKLGEKNLTNLADFVRERGGGLLFIAGERYSPHAFRNTPLQDLLPVELLATPAGVAERPDSFRPELTTIGRFHPIFRFTPDESDNVAVWNKLAELYWWAEGYRPKPAAEVLLVHPKQPAAGPRRPGDPPEERHALAVQQFVGAGRTLFFGIEETWRWRHREDELRFNQFWIQTVRYLARSRSGRIRLLLDRQVPYRRGEPIRVSVRFPDDAPPPGPEVKVEVIKERTPPGSGEPAERDLEVLRLTKVEGSRATYEHVLTRTPEGEYRFTLGTPDSPQGKPRAECRVLPPPGEMEQLKMNQADMERSAEETRGRFYTLADADQLLDDLPAGTRVSLHTPTPPWLLWNHDAVFAWALALLGAEWVLRKRKHLL
jgi:Aerotolerance regulator N-terminal/von Willebrand factor type A domain